ncbi:unnamed protein product [marine sediment metagenome]|uniref:Uncharacterized protein n=1 Tax=marine sediment metagenome TaxID=412755 RepID=X0YZ77_9ZZZZ
MPYPSDERVIGHGLPKRASSRSGSDDWVANHTVSQPEPYATWNLRKTPESSSCRASRYLVTELRVDETVSEFNYQVDKNEEDAQR